MLRKSHLSHPRAATRVQDFRTDLGKNVLNMAKMVANPIGRKSCGPNIDPFSGSSACLLFPHRFIPTPRARPLFLGVLWWVLVWIYFIQKKRIGCGIKCYLTLSSISVGFDIYYSKEKDWVWYKMLLNSLQYLSWF